MIQPGVRQEQLREAFNNEGGALEEVAGQPQFGFRPPPPRADPSVFKKDISLGSPFNRNPREIERMKRKRLALLNPKAQQARRFGRGMNEIRYQGGYNPNNQ